MSRNVSGRFDGPDLPEVERASLGGTTQTETIAGLTAMCDKQAEELKKLRREKDAQRLQLQSVSKDKDKANKLLASADNALTQMSQDHRRVENAARGEIKDYERKIKALNKEAAAKDKAHSKELAALKKARDAAERSAEEAETKSKLYAAAAGDESDFQRRVQEICYVAMARFDKRERDLAASEKALAATLAAARTAKDAADAKAATLEEQLHASDAKVKSLEKQLRSAEAKGKSLEEQLRDEKTVHASRVAQVRTEYVEFNQKLTARLGAQCQERLDSRKEEHERDLEQLRAQLETARRAALDAQAADSARVHDRLAQSFVQDHTTALLALEAQHEKKLAALRDEYEGQIDELIDAHEDHIGTLKNKLRELTSSPQREWQGGLPLPETPTRPPPQAPPPELPPTPQTPTWTPQTPTWTPPAVNRRVSK